MTQRILIIHDNEQFLSLLCELLTEECYDVRCCALAWNDIDEIMQIKPDVIVMNLVFREEKRGLILLETIKIVPSTASIPVILCATASREIEEMQQHFLQKKIRLVFKPFELDDLITAIQLSVMKTVEHPRPQVQHRKEKTGKIASVNEKIQE